jgi:hypothetical protein
MDEERDDLIASMYQSDDAETQQATQIEPSGFNRTRKIRVGIIEYEVPTIEYVHRLEILIASQGKMIERQKHMIDDLRGSVVSTRNFLRRQTSNMVEMREDLNQKIDHS